jgi:DNA excision repair protein ERCC-4
MNRPKESEIVVDFHEQVSGIPKRLEALGWRVRVAHLGAGDYVIVSGATVERKRVLDLHVSIIEGRFWSQIGRLRRASSRPYLLLEGTNLDRGPLHRNSIRGACLAVAEQGIRVIRSVNQDDSARWLHCLAMRCRKRSDVRDRPIYAQTPKMKLASDAAEAVIAAVPGLSTVSARALLDHFGTVARVVEADPTDWLAVPGIGPAKAAALADVLSSSRRRREEVGPST